MKSTLQSFPHAERNSCVHVLPEGADDVGGEPRRTPYSFRNGSRYWIHIALASCELMFACPFSCGLQKSRDLEETVPNCVWTGTKCGAHSLKPITALTWPCWNLALNCPFTLDCQSFIDFEPQSCGTHSRLRPSSVGQELQV